MSKPKQPRKELTSLRLEPQVKYLAEIASRVQRRSLTNFIEWVLEESIKNMTLRDDPYDDRTLGDLSFLLWDINESERLIKLALIAPELLSYEEQLIFKVLTHTPYKFINFNEFAIIIDTSGYQIELPDEAGFKGIHKLELQHFNTEKINDCWENILQIANGNKDKWEGEIYRWAPTIDFASI